MRTANLLQMKAEISTQFNESTFTQCSLDTANQYILINNLTVKIFNFDEIKENLVKLLPNPKCMEPDSLDSLFLGKNDLVFFEFKNTELKYDEIRMKIYESISLICNQYSLNNNDIKGSTIYLIHRTDNPSTHRYTNGLCPNKLFFVEDVLGIKILRYDAKTFEQYLNKYGDFPSRT